MENLFNQIKQEMNSAADMMDISYFRNAAKALGCIETDIGSTFTIRYQYTLVNNLGESIKGTLRSYDQSGPFQMLPDMNKIEMHLERNGQQVDAHFVSWED
ncbi:hypothetical protein WH43_14175 [Rheinheimera sp. KL1]|uniref:hypothetical protein n=1 Tax=Rheinheimera sp. KL1 TaxID=1635005 RepID=UPI0006A95D32|nr:hypothetical protein [Rheinheimera sp. KL1]KOO57240.1 hypothetical protein WH43_14175 [Rheinheimera sp. KL1]